MTEFTPFFEIDLAHDFYGDRRPAIQFEADESTFKLGARPDLQLRLSAGKLECFAAKDRQALRLLADQQKADKLENIALKITGLKTVADSVPDAEQKLASLEKAMSTVTAQNNRLSFTFRLRPEDSNLPYVTEAVASAANKIAVVNLDAESGALQDEEALISAANLRDLKVERSGLDALITAPDIDRPPLAILQVEIAPTTENIVYKVRFGSVKRYWIYHILGSHDDATFTINDTKGDIEFDPLVQARRANGTLIRSYKSNLAIPAQFRPLERFKLLQNGPLGPKTVLPVLPSPVIGPGVMDGTQISSEIYVNL